MIDNYLLNKVEKPSRYTGGEWNIIKKEIKNISVRFAFCFPDIYDVGMSHLGMKILYHLINETDDFYCERVFAPWFDMEELMRTENIELFSLETKEPLKVFDFIGFTLQYEMSYTNILNMLDLGNIPLKRTDRSEQHPIVCAGGPCTVNPEPLADFVDFFVIGEAEEVIIDILNIYKDFKNNGKSKKDFLYHISDIEGIYVPELYNVIYDGDIIKEFKCINDNKNSIVKKRFIKDMDKVYFPDKFVVPYVDIVHDRVTLELFRGCIRGCRFCQAGYIYRPVREKSKERLIELAKKLIANTGYEEISLTSLSTSDYTEFNELADRLINYTENKKVNISLPSLRVDNFSLDLMERAQKVRKGGLTFAPEAGTQRLRDVINKGVTAEDLYNSVKIAFEGGWTTIKLYFMMGLPTETFEDLDGIYQLACDVVDIYFQTPKEVRGKGLKVNVSVSSFVPKPFTPFQWEKQDSQELLFEKQMYLKEKFKSRNKFIKYTWHDAKISFLESVFARGDRRLGDILYRAWKKGCKFDSWGEKFNNNLWLEAFNEGNLDPKIFSNRERSFDEVLPWDHIDIGVNKEYLMKEAKDAYDCKITLNCKEKCSNCGIVSFKGGLCFGN